MKTIGLLGGLGPQATMDLETRLHAVAQKLIPQNGNRGYPPMYVYYHRRPPVFTHDDLTPVLPIQADPELLEGARWLAEKADFLILSANSAHLLQSDIERASGRSVLSMIEATLEEVMRRGWKKIGVLGFPDPNVTVYTRRLTERGLRFEVLTAEQQAPLNQAITRVSQGQLTPGVAQTALEILRGRDVDGIIPGCTEIPLLLGADMNASDLVNPAQLLAEAAIVHALT
ncbi:MAG: amino acid racemase [Pleurocapsa sp. SU_196_0]|nr:amino acid racemase [Pleurocapsa sp. SU_196_0]